MSISVIPLIKTAKSFLPSLRWGMVCGVAFWTLNASAQPVCTIAKPGVNMGDVMYQEPRTIVYEVKNTGNKPLTIEAAHPSCGCTVVDYSAQPIPPGGMMELKATYDAAMMGSFNKEIELLTNASDTPIYLHFYGRVTNNPKANITEFPVDLDNVRISTNTIEFDDVNKGDCPVAELQILNTTRMAYQPQLMHLPSYLTATYEPAIVQGGRVGRILLTLDSKKLADMGLNQRSIYLARYPGDKVAADNEIAVSAVLLPDFRGVKNVASHITATARVDSTTIHLGAFGKKKALKGAFTITNTGRTPLEVKRLQPFSKALGVSLGTTSIAPGKSAKIKVTVNHDMLLRDKNHLRILLITNDPDMPKLTLSVVVEKSDEGRD